MARYCLAQVCCASALFVVGAHSAGASSVYGSIYDFASGSGSAPISAAVTGHSGEIYGTASSGGDAGFGVVFSFNPVLPFVYTPMYSFSGTDGANPETSLCVGDSSGYYYGTTLAGGSSGLGTVFKILDQAPYTFVSMHSFTGSDGSSPISIGPLLLAKNGLLYGTTQLGGSQNLGTIYSISTASPYTLTTVYSFSGPDGANPVAGLSAGPGSQLYGTTSAGGAFGFGAIYRVNPSTNVVQKLHDFTGVDGANCYATLKWDKSKTLYGVTQFGGLSNQGTVFAFNAQTDVLATLHSFNGTTGGGQPIYASLLEQSDGYMYGATTSGGTNDLGTMFAINPSGVFRVLLSCSTQQGWGCTGLITSDEGLADKDGVLWGMASDGGANGAGAVLAIVP